MDVVTDRLEIEDTITLLKEEKNDILSNTHKSTCSMVVVFMAYVYACIS